MADPTTPTTLDPAQQAQALNQLTQAQQQSTAAQSDSLDVMTLVQKGMDGIEKAAKAASISLNNLSNLSEPQIESFGLLSSAAVNAREAFKGFANVDYSGLSTFTEQITDIRTALEKVPAAKAAESLKMLADSMVKAGVGQDRVTAALNKGKEAVLDLAKNVFTHADNMLRAQTAYVQMAARTGELGDVMSAAGDKMMNMNDVLEKQQQMLKFTREATGLSADQVEKWYSQLGSIPGALKAVVDTDQKAGDTTSMLTAVIQTATGSGREMGDVMKDLNVAFRDYGIVGEKALLFSTRMSDISTRLKAPIEDVTNALRGSADAFKMFATGQDNASKSAESLAKTLNEYGKALESTGLSASAAVEVAANLSNQVTKLSTGQLSFISQRTGGAGGLMGAAQETLKAQTDPGAVVRDAMNTLKQQFGTIMTVKDAAQSEAAASQWIKQTAMLQQLLGPLAKDQATANRLLEAMKNGLAPGTEPDLSPTIVQDAAQKGADMQAKSYGVLTESRNLLEQIRDIGDRGASDMASKITAGQTNQTTAGFQNMLKTSLSEHMRTSRAAGGDQVRGATQEMATGSVRPTAGVDFGDAMQRWAGSMKEIPIAIRATFETIKGTFSKLETDSSKHEQEMLNQFIAARKEQAQQVAASQSVGIAAQSSIANPAGGIPSLQGTGSMPAIVPGQPGGPGTLNIVGKITIDCPHCGKPHDASNQFKITAGPAGQTGQ